MTNSVQQKLFEKIHERYQYHYYDKYSNFYRKLIILEKIRKFFKNKKNILEIGCGGGSNYLTFKREKLIRNNNYLALDISSKAVKDFNLICKNDENANAFQCDFTQKNLKFEKKKFDLILFIGVLHHMTNDMDEVFNNIANNLNENGLVIFFEPNAHFLNWLRKIWYKISDEFDDVNERALYPEEIDHHSKKHSLKLNYCKYIGNIGFFVILQSMILRTPKWLKSITYFPLTYLDLFFEKFQIKNCLGAMIRIYENDSQ